MKQPINTTPGPWKVDDPEDASNVGPGDKAVCLLFDSHYELPLPDEDQAEANANGHLIAAAPDLYDALEFVMRTCSLYGAADRARAKAERALAKARGEER